MADVPVFDTRVRPPYGSFADVAMVAQVDPRNYTSRRLSVPDSIAAGPDYDRFLREVGEARVVRCLVAGRAGVALGASPENADVVALVESDPALYVGAWAMNTDSPQEAVDGFRRARREGIVAAVVEPGLAAQPRYVDDPHLDPIWAVCEELDLPALVMCGGICGPDITWSDPVAFDRLAARWPGVRFVAAKGGHPFVLQMLGVAFRRTNVWVSPDLWMCNMPGAELYVEAANTFLADRFLYASAYPLVSLKESLDIWQAHSFAADVRARVFHENAERLFGI